MNDSPRLYATSVAFYIRANSRRTRMRRDTVGAFVSSHTEVTMRSFRKTFLQNKTTVIAFLSGALTANTIATLLYPSYGLAVINLLWFFCLLVFRDYVTSHQETRSRSAGD